MDGKRYDRLEHLRPKVEGHDAEASKQLEAALAQLNGAARAGAPELVGLLARLPDVLGEADRRELERLRAKHGAEHPRVRAREAESAQDDATMELLRQIVKRAERVLHEAPAAGEWVLHGYVSDVNLQGLEAFQVVASDDEGGRILQRTASGEDGYYRLTLGTGRAGGGGRDARDAQPGSDGKRAPRAEHAEGPTEAYVEIRILDATGKLAQVDPVPALVRAGQVEYREYRVEAASGGDSPG